jgi:hypothetical protein
MTYLYIGLALSFIALIFVGKQCYHDLEVAFYIGIITVFIMIVAWPICLPLAIGIYLGNKDN